MQYILTHTDDKMVLDILMKGPSLDWTDDNQLHDCFKVWRKVLEMLMTGMTLKKESGETSYSHIETVGLTGDDAASKKCILDTLEELMR